MLKVRNVGLFHTPFSPFSSSYAFIAIESLSFSYHRLIFYFCQISRPTWTLEPDLCRLQSVKHYGLLASLPHVSRFCTLNIATTHSKPPYSLHPFNAHLFAYLSIQRWLGLLGWKITRNIFCTLRTTKPAQSRLHCCPVHVDWC